MLKDFEISKKYLKYPILSTSTSCWQMNFLCLSLTSSMTDITISCLKNVGGKLLIFNKKFLPTCLSPQLSYYQLFCLNWPHGISSLCELWNYLSHHHLYCSAEKGSQFHNIWHLSGKITREVTFIFYLNRFLFLWNVKSRSLFSLYPTLRSPSFSESLTMYWSKGSRRPSSKNVSNFSSNFLPTSHSVKLEIIALIFPELAGIVNKITWSILSCWVITIAALCVSLPWIANFAETNLILLPFDKKWISKTDFHYFEPALSYSSFIPIKFYDRNMKRNIN